MSLLSCGHLLSHCPTISRTKGFDVLQYLYSLLLISRALRYGELPDSNHLLPDLEIPGRHPLGASFELLLLRHLVQLLVVVFDSLNCESFPRLVPGLSHFFVLLFLIFSHLLLLMHPQVLLKFEELPLEPWVRKDYGSSLSRESQGVKHWEPVLLH